ncbi:MAG: hypothetical protein H6704_18105 [Myxococcales bacterium]|nr:hypothetical protein [Myxococcales bacterium]
MKTTMTAKVSVTRISTHARVHRTTDRPDLQALCAAAHDAPLDAARAASVWPDLTARAAGTLVKALRRMGLLGRGGTLTAAGERCRAAAQVVEVEEGQHHLWVAEHPLLGRRALHVERVGDDDRRRDDRGRDDDVIALSGDACDAHPRPSVLTGQELLVERVGPGDLAPAGRISPQTAATLTVDVDFDADRATWTLEGTLHGAREGQDFRTVPVRLELDTQALYARWEPDWSVERGRLLMGYDDDPSDPPFFRDWTYDPVTLPDGGTFRDVTVLGVPVAPLDDAEAARWALALWARRAAALDAPTRRDALTRDYAALVAGTPVAAVPAPALDALLQRLRADRARDAFWRVAAPHDLNPTEVIR